MTDEEIVRYVVARAVWAPSVHNTQLGDGACPHLVLRIGLVTQVALSVRRDPGDVLFPVGDDRADSAPG